MVILPKTNLDTATFISERIRQALEQHRFIDDLVVTISGGIKEYKGGSITEFINEADIILYEAKKQGKNKIV